MVEITTTVSATADETIRGSGIGITRSDWLDTDGASISKKHSFLTDTSNRGKIIDAENTGGGSWASAGGSSIEYDASADTWYVALRQRYSDGSRGKQWELWENTTGNLTTASDWSQTWQLDRTNVSNLTFDSIEECCLREFSGTWYFYFGYSPSSGPWRVGYVSASTVSGIKTQLSDANNYTVIWDGSSPGYKDPKVYQLNGSWFARVSNLQSNDVNNRELWRSSTADFSSKTLVSTPSDAYVDQFNITNPDLGDGTLLYDDSANRFVYWGVHNNSGSIYWYYVVSEDLSSWTYYDREDTGTTVGGTLGNSARYLDYYHADDQRGVLLLDWNGGSGDVNDVYLWDYRAVDTAGNASTTSYTPKVDVTVYEDVGADGTGPNTGPAGRNFDNSDSVQATDGTATATLPALDGAIGNSYWLEIELIDLEPTTTPTVESVELVV